MQVRWAPPLASQDWAQRRRELVDAVKAKRSGVLEVQFASRPKAAQLAQRCHCWGQAGTLHEAAPNVGSSGRRFGLGRNRGARLDD